MSFPYFSLIFEFVYQEPFSLTVTFKKGEGMGVRLLTKFAIVRYTFKGSCKTNDDINRHRLNE